MRQLLEVIIPTQTGSTTISSPIASENLLYISVMAVATGTEVGSVRIQVSNDKVAPGFAPVNFVDLSGATIAVSSAGVYLIPKIELCYQFIRIVYTHTSGSGDITITTKTIGA